MLYVADREGWLGIHADVDDVENSLEEIDVLAGEYVVIDAEGVVMAAFATEA